MHLLISRLFYTPIIFFFILSWIPLNLNGLENISEQELNTLRKSHLLSLKRKLNLSTPPIESWGRAILEAQQNPLEPVIEAKEKNDPEITAQPAPPTKKEDPSENSESLVAEISELREKAKEATLVTRYERNNFLMTAKKPFYLTNLSPSYIHCTLNFLSPTSSYPQYTFYCRENVTRNIYILDLPEDLEAYLLLTLKKGQNPNAQVYGVCFIDNFSNWVEFDKEGKQIGLARSELIRGLVFIRPFPQI